MWTGSVDQTSCKTIGSRWAWGNHILQPDNQYRHPRRDMCSPPLLFSLDTNDCTSGTPYVKQLRFAYRQEVKQLAFCCGHNKLEHAGNCVDDRRLHQERPNITPHHRTSLLWKSSDYWNLQSPEDKSESIYSSISYTSIKYKSSSIKYRNRKRK